MVSASSGRAAALLVGATALLIVPAVLAELDAPGGGANGQPTLIAVVAVAFVTSGLAWLRTSFPPLVGLLLLAGSTAWLLPSLLPTSLLWHQGLLLLALAAPFADRARALVWVSVATTVALGMGGQAWAAVAFACVAATGLSRAGDPRTARLLQAASAASAAAVLAVLWAWRSSGSYDPLSGLVTYEMALVGICLLLGVGATVRYDRTARLSDRLIADPSDDGMEGLLAIMRAELGDPSLRLLAPGSAGVPVIEDGRPVAVLRSQDRTLSDPAAASAVVEAVRVVRHWAVAREVLARREAELADARRRVAEAVDGERATVGQELSARVLSEIDGALADLAAVGPPSYGGSGDAPAAEARAQLLAARKQVGDIVEGTADDLTGGLVAALSLLAARSAVPCAFRCDEAAPVSSEAARALYFVCSEALANVHKHSAASRASVELSTLRDSVVLRVADNGIGDVDPSGGGLRGLAARMEELGGALAVSGSAGSGAQVVAKVPRGQPVEAIRTHGRSTR